MEGPTTVVCTIWADPDCQQQSCPDPFIRRPSIFLYAKNPQNLGETWPPVPVFIPKASDPLESPAERAVTVGWHRIAIQRRRCVGVCVGGGGCADVRAGACARVCVCAPVRA